MKIGQIFYKKQLVSIAIFENQICTRYLANVSMIEQLSDLTFENEIMIPEVLVSGIYGFKENIWEFLSKGYTPDFEIRELKEITINELQSILENNNEIKLLE